MKMEDTNFEKLLALCYSSNDFHVAFDLKNSTNKNLYKRGIHML